MRNDSTVSASRLALHVLMVLALFALGVCGRAAERLFFQAEDMAVDGQNWKAIDHFGGWYQGSPSGTQLLRGATGKQGEAKKALEIKVPGVYNVWVRYIDTRFRGPFQVTVTQQGAVVGEKIFDEKSLRLGNPEGLKKWGDGAGQFVWDHLQVTLAAGPVEVVTTKVAPLVVSSVTRNLDCFVLTNDLKYEPKTSDFVTPLYIKVKMGPTQQEPCVIHIFGRHPREPWFPPHSNIFKTKAGPGTGTGYRPGGKNETFLTAGDESVWFNIAPLLDEMGMNALQLYAIQEYNNILPTADFTVFVSKTPSDDGIFKRFSRSGSGGGMALSIDLTKLDTISSDLENSKMSAEVAAKMPPAPGKRPSRFPLITGCQINSGFHQSATVENEVKMMTALGMSGLSGYDPVFYAHGVTKLRPGAGFFNLTNNGCMSDPKTEQIRVRVREAVQALLDKGVGKDIVSWKLMDEPGSMSFDHIIGCPKCAAAFQAYLKKQGLQPATLGKKEWAEIKPVKDPAGGAELYYHSVNFRCQALADFFQIATDAAREVDPLVRTHANYGEDLTYNGNGLKYGVDWFMIHGQGALSSGWTEEWLNHSATYQLCGYRADYLRAACRGQFFGMYNIMRSPWDTQAKTAANIGHGAQAIFYFNYGPKYAAVVDSHSERTEVMTAVRMINHSVGSVEDYLVDARVPATKIGLLHTRTTDVWTLPQAFSNYGKERMGLYLLLRHLGYPVEILTEDDAAAKKLQGYQAIFVTGSHLRRDAANGLVQWVTDGGRLYYNAGSLTFDEYNRPLNLDAALGITRKLYEEKANVGREYFEVPALKNLESYTVQGKELESVCGLQKVEGLAGARVAAAFADQSPAAFTKPLGKGQLIFCGTFPGIAYLKSGAVAAKEARGDLSRQDLVTYNPPSYAEGYRLLFADLLNGLAYTPPVKTSHYLVEANLLEHENGYVVTLSNWTGKPVTGLTVSLMLPKKPEKAFAARGPIKSQAVQQGVLTLTLDLKEADFIVLPFTKK